MEDRPGLVHARAILPLLKMKQAVVEEYSFVP